MINLSSDDLKQKKKQYKTPTMVKRSATDDLDYSELGKQLKTLMVPETQESVIAASPAYAPLSPTLPPSECSRLYCKGLVTYFTVRDEDVVLAAAGVAICDLGDNPLFGNRRSLGVSEGGAKAEVAELEAIIEGLKQALNLNLKSVIFFCDDILIYQYVMYKKLPGSSKVATLVNQVTLLQRKFEYCSPHLVASDDIKFAFQFATDAINSQITWPAEVIKAKSWMETCLICFEDTEMPRMFSISQCRHKYCSSCLKRHVEVKLQDGMVAQCPHKDCKTEATIKRCKHFLPSKLVDSLKERIKVASMPVAEKVYCPYPRCSALMSKKEVLEYTKTSFVSEGGRKCMTCHKYFCIHCMVPWHYNMACNEYKRSQTYLQTEDHLLKSLATKKLWRQCSKCNDMVELASGCYHIYCRCGYQFCYTCGAEWKKKKATCSCPLWSEHNIITRQ